MFTNKIIFILIFFLISSCSNFKPVYKDNLQEIYQLQSFAILTDKKKASLKIKKALLNLFPVQNKVKYIIKIETESDTRGTVSDSTRKISRYKNEISANVKIYYRDKSYDKLIYLFEEKNSSPYTLVLNNIRSTLASKKKAEQTTIRLLSEEIYKRLLIFLSNNKS